MAKLPPLKTTLLVLKKIQRKTSVNASSIGKKSDSSTPPFLLTFEICNRKVHNCMIDSGALKNVMPYSVCKKLNAVLVPCDTSIVQLDRSNVKVIGKLNEFLIRLASNPQVHFIIDIIVVDIPKAYGLFLNRDWYEKLKGYFATDWSHLWLPHNGRPNKIRIDQERYMKHTVIELDDSNEPVLFTDTIMGNYVVDSFFGNLESGTSSVQDPE